MLIDHIGVLFFPQYMIFRVIGRTAMPLYAYCIGRGYYYSRMHGTLDRYLKNVFWLLVASQIPYALIGGKGLNICGTWLFSLLLLTAFDRHFDTGWKKAVWCCGIYGITAVMYWKGIIISDYGIGGVTTPLLFYLLIKQKKENWVNYMLAVLIGWVVYVMSSGTASSLGQIFSLGSVAVLAVCHNRDSIIRLPKWFFYWFYPVHLTILLLIKAMT